MTKSLFRMMPVVCAVMAMGWGAWAQDAVRIQSVGGTDDRIRIATPPFFGLPDAAPHARSMAAVLGEDLNFSGLFAVVDTAGYPASFRGFGADAARISFQQWRSTPAEYLVYGSVALEKGSIVTEVRLFDVKLAQQVVGKRLRAEQKWARLLAHKFADESVRFLTGVAGIASSEICFSAGKPGAKEIYVADYDGASVTKVTDHRSISIKPKFSPDGRKIAYLSYKDRYPFLYVLDRETGKTRSFSRHVGLNHAPAWAPDGERLAYVLSKDGNTEIYLKKLGGSTERRLTNSRGSDTSPSFSPDGRHIVFVSDRGGSPQLYLMDLDGGNEKRLSFQGGNSYDPAWSPDGKRIAYVVEGHGQGLEIYTMNADGTGVRQLTNAYGSSESPSWSADSRHIVFGSRRSGNQQLYTVNADSGVVRQVPNLEHLYVEGPSWGPRRK